MIGAILLIVGIGFLLYQIFVNSGGKAKFKSDLPETETTKKRSKIKCFTILFLACLAALFLTLTVLSFIL